MIKLYIFFIFEHNQIVFSKMLIFMILNILGSIFLTFDDQVTAKVEKS
jgi:hypothetical protein